MTSSKNSPKNWSEWNNTIQFTDYSRNSKDQNNLFVPSAAVAFACKKKRPKLAS